MERFQSIFQQGMVAGIKKNIYCLAQIVKFASFLFYKSDLVNKETI